MRHSILILIFAVSFSRGLAQDTGAIPGVDTSTPTKTDTGQQNLVGDTVHKDSVSTVSALPGFKRKPDSLHSAPKDSFVSVIQQAPVKKDTVVKKKEVQLKAGIERNQPDKDLVFFVLIFILFFLGLIKTSFPKYFSSIFSLSFQATFRQIQTREQMAQNVIPAFMLNTLFILSGGLFITLFAQFNNWTAMPFWQLFVYSSSILGIIYLAKYFVILFTGWVFNATDSAAEYRFIVFLINKLMGILLIPSLFLIAYAGDEIKSIAITVALCVAVFMIVLRYLISLARIRKNLHVPAFHFFIYLCAIEIMPMLVIYKLLFLRSGNIK